MRNTQNPEVFLDMSIGWNLAERIEIERDLSVEFFLMYLISGKHTGKPMYLKGSTFYNIVRGKWAEVFVFLPFSLNGFIVSVFFHRYSMISKASATMMISGTGGENIYGIPFFDEGERLKHDAPYLLTTASDYHKYTIGSCFFITFNELHELDGKHVVFGRVVRGYETVQKIEQVQAFPDGRPEHLVIITACGVSPKTRSLNSILIRKGIAFAEFSKQFEISMLFFPEKNQYDLPYSSLPSEGRYSRKRKLICLSIADVGLNYEGDGNSAKESAPRRVRREISDARNRYTSKLSDKTHFLLY
ncbi:hypothetical protein POTOM_037724 [Populus tomentosa]|uniref:PPIase cyclophilin-type domain-containing protein n=1 Tax=Populus tomentosa TaxID=118781 RepID=A0A8X8CKD4_POPTO|nr:hypothetical protein POTOM_037724 [Populus tomentosa]